MNVAGAVDLKSNSAIHFGFMPAAEEVNRKIFEFYSLLNAQDFERRSHFFHGRYENLYLKRERIPAIGSVLHQAETYAASLLGMSMLKLRSGFWINDMGPNAVTSEHDHDDYDELLSAVYYVQVPKNSGELIIVDQYSRTIVTPEAGMFMFFAPNVRHAVSINNSDKRRLSIGMNFGPVPQ
jgi:hypothetical protein